MTTKPVSKPLPQPLIKRVPLWLVLSLAAAVALLLYGAMVPSPPSAFDRPEAQSPVRARSPWNSVR